MVDDNPQRRTVLKGSAVAALASITAGSAAARNEGGAHVTDAYAAVDDTNSVDTNTTDANASDGDGETSETADEAVDRNVAAEMLREYYDGYIEGISQAVATEIQMEAAMIEQGDDQPWPLAVWDDVEDARYAGIELGASGGGSQPFYDEYTSFDRDYDGDDEIDV
ncbi:twin-arginine translocation signal domain-containing protein [Natronolimnohabitans innermongolicus]|uniref:Uncharacterized protein n=1 Tax=Natronolimnohabitans innermongolicus JCM 12255 TaxID=1227499 RepID=L9WJB8_9EURY|nr:twin-arginine translocation signal domain-containing protein [Natronolimnohabitans innermongolicus]ELY49331.1 hypothetical protein C493_20711 [Natronolimnohabitans innermongolicus JCM 12255]